MERGSRIGSYVIDEEVGRGAFGVVFRAHHHTLADQVVALKIPTNDDVRELLRAGALQHMVDHPGVVQVIDLDPRNDPPYLAMEWVEGETLEARLSARAWRALAACSDSRRSAWVVWTWPTEATTATGTSRASGGSPETGRRASCRSSPGGSGGLSGG